MITKRQFSTLEDLFDYYNEVLFNRELPDCLVNLSRHKGAHGFFAPQQWKSKKDKQPIHEISLNPDSVSRPDIDWHATLVHEMVHLWQETFGKPSRANYHNKQWSIKMESVGLMPSDTAQEGGKRIGQGMTHYIMDNGPFLKAFNTLTEEDKENLKLPYAKNSYFETVEKKEPEEGKEPPVKKKNKIKYTCSCGHNVWGKPNLHIKCNDCDSDFVTDSEVESILIHEPEPNEGFEEETIELLELPDNNPF